MDAVDRLFALIDARYKEQKDFASAACQRMEKEDVQVLYQVSAADHGSTGHHGGVYPDRQRRKPGSRRSRTDAGICPDI